MQRKLEKRNFTPENQGKVKLWAGTTLKFGRAGSKAGMSLWRIESGPGVKIIFDCFAFSNFKIVFQISLENRFLLRDC